MILVDTGYLLALVQRKDALHVRAAAWSRSVKESLLVTEYVMVEAVNALSKSSERPRVPALLEHLRTSPQYEFLAASQELFDAGLELHSERPDKEWSLTDCISFEVMEARGITRALAYDHHFEQAGYIALLRRDPD
jgi:predicted nucleic acid-binding protein